MGFDLGKAFEDAANTAGTIITHPADDVNAVVKAATHPADIANGIGNAVGAYTKWLGDGINQAAGSVSGLVTKIANNSIVAEALQIATGAIYCTLAITIGPLALAIFAAPALLQGDKDFVHAWLEGFVGQTQRAIKALSAGNVDFDVLPPDIQDQVSDITQQITSQTSQVSNFLQQYPQVGQLAQQLGVPDPSKITPQMIADKLGVREDAAAAALTHYLGKVGGPTGQAAMQNYNSMAFDPVTGQQTSWETTFQSLRAAGKALEAKSPIITAARKLSNDPNYTLGFDLGIGAMSQKTSAQTLVQDRNVVLSSHYMGPDLTAAVASTQPSAVAARNNAVKAQTGFDAAVAMYKGAVMKGSAGFATSGLLPATKAGAIITHGLQKMPATSRVAVMTTIAQDPNARAGATAAVKSIAASKDKSWWDKFLTALGLEA